MQLLGAHLVQEWEVRVRMLRARRIERVGGADLLVLLAHVPRDHARVRAVAADHRLDRLVASDSRLVQRGRAVNDVQAVQVRQFVEACVRGPLLDCNRVHAVALTPHDVLDHVLQAHREPGAPIALVTAHPVQRQRAARQAQALGGRRQIAEANLQGDRVLRTRLIVAQCHDERVQHRLLGAPREHVQAGCLEILAGGGARGPDLLLLALAQQRGPHS